MERKIRTWDKALVPSYFTAFKSLPGCFLVIKNLSVTFLLLFSFNFSGNVAAVLYTLACVDFWNFPSSPSLSVPRKTGFPSGLSWRICTTLHSVFSCNICLVFHLWSELLEVFLLSSSTVGHWSLVRLFLYILACSCNVLKLHNCLRKVTFCFLAAFLL